MEFEVILPKIDVTKKVMSMSLDLDLAERVREISDRSGRSMSFVIEKCVAEYLPVMEKGEDEDTRGATKKTLYDVIQETFDFFKDAGMKPAYYRIDNDSFRIIFDLTPGKKKSQFDELRDDDFDINAEDKRCKSVDRKNKQFEQKEKNRRIQKYKEEHGLSQPERHGVNKDTEATDDAVNPDEKQSEPESRCKRNKD
jgi:hypothetical protein